MGRRCESVTFRKVDSCGTNYKGYIRVDVEEIIPLSEEVILSAMTQADLDIFYSKVNPN